MFNFFKSKTKNQNQQTVTLKLSGLHCSSCAVNIDLTLEDLPGIISSKTNYAKMSSAIEYDPAVTNPKEFSKSIVELGYTIVD